MRLITPIDHNGPQLREDVNKAARTDKIEGMIKRRMTVFVLGAGASYDYGLPLGEGLANKIISEVGGDSRRPQALEEWTGTKADTWISLAEDLRESCFNSIDAWLSRRTMYLNAGKIAICHAIGASEDPGKLRTGWYRELWQVLASGAQTASDICENRVGVITFNYDRSLEHFLYERMRPSFGVSAEDAARIIQRIPIIHMHGQAGALPWQKPDPVEAWIKTNPLQKLEAPDSHPYLANATFDQNAWIIARIRSSGIRVMFEDHRGEGAPLMQARNLLANADRIIFMGFGYDPINMRKLRYTPDSDKSQEIQGTYFEGTRSKTSIASAATNNFGQPITMVDIKSLTEFVRQHIVSD